MPRREPWCDRDDLAREGLGAIVLTVGQKEVSERQVVPVVIRLRLDRLFIRRDNLVEIGTLVRRCQTPPRFRVRRFTLGDTAEVANGVFVSAEPVCERAGDEQDGNRCGIPTLRSPDAGSGSFQPLSGFHVEQLELCLCETRIW